MISRLRLWPGSNSLDCTPDNPEYLYLLSLAREDNVENTITASLPMSPLAIHPCHARLVWTSRDYEQYVLPFPDRTPMFPVTCDYTDVDSTTSLGSSRNTLATLRLVSWVGLQSDNPICATFHASTTKSDAIMKLEPCVIVHVAVIHSLYSLWLSEFVY